VQGAPLDALVRVVQGGERVVVVYGVGAARPGHFLTLLGKHRDGPGLLIVDGLRLLDDVPASLLATFHEQGERRAVLVTTTHEDLLAAVSALSPDAVRGVPRPPRLHLRTNPIRIAPESANVATGDGGEDGVSLAIAFTNGGGAPLVVRSVRSPCSCTRVGPVALPIVLAPDETGSFTVTVVPSKWGVGMQRKSVVLVTNDPGQPLADVVIEGQLREKPDPTEILWYPGCLEMGETSTRMRYSNRDVRLVVLGPLGGPPPEILSAEASVAGLRLTTHGADAVAGRAAVSLSLDFAGVCQGPFKGKIVVRAGVQTTHTLEVPVRGAILPDQVMAFPSRLTLVASSTHDSCLRGTVYLRSPCRESITIGARRASLDQPVTVRLVDESDHPDLAKLGVVFEALPSSLLPVRGELSICVMRAGGDEEEIRIPVDIRASSVGGERHAQ